MNVKYLNIFKINIEKIEMPKFTYIYNIKLYTSEEEKIKKYLKVLENMYGVVNNKEKILYSYKQIENLPNHLKKEVNVELKEKILFKNLDNEEIYEKLLITFLRKEIKKELYKKLQLLEDKYLEKNKNIGNWCLSFDLLRKNVEILKIKNNYYAVINIKLNILANINLWDLIKRNKNKLELLKWNPENPRDTNIWFSFAPDIKEKKSRNYILKEVVEKERYKPENGLSYEDLLSYPVTNRNVSKEELKNICNYIDIDPNQPVIKGIPNYNSKQILSFLPQYCIPAYHVYLASKEENKKIFEIKKNIIFQIKDKIIKDLVESIEYLESPIENDFEIKTLDFVTLKTKFIKIKVSLNKKNKKPKVKILTTTPYLRNITSTYDLFKWVKYFIEWDEKEELILEIPVPDYVPPYFKKIDSLATFMLFEKTDKICNKKKSKILRDQIVKLYNILKYSYRSIGINVPDLDFKNKSIEFDNNENGIKELIRHICSIESKLNLDENSLKFAFIFGSTRNNRNSDDEENYDYYNPIKKILFDNNILSQNFLIENHLFKKEKDKNLAFILPNIIYNLFSKLGIKFFTLDNKVNYDYILGVDVGYNESYIGKTASCTTIVDSKGLLKNIIPISKENWSNRETARVKALLEEIEIKTKWNIDFTGKNILILRDGKIPTEEIKQLIEFSKKRKCKITVIGIKKNTVFQLFYKDKNANKKSNNSFYVNLRSYYILKSHSPDHGFPRLIKIDQKVIIDKGDEKYEDINEEDILMIYKLTALNYSKIKSKSNLRIPAPIYYADKFVKALKRGWKLDKDYLKQGILYFI